MNFSGSDENPVQGVVRKRIRNNYCEPVVFLNHNSLLDTRKHGVHYLDCFVEEITAYQISKNMLAQVESEGNQFLLPKEMTDHFNYAFVINKTNGFLTIIPGKFHSKKTNRGWTLQLERKDGSVELVLLKYIKQSNSIDLAE